MRSAHVPPASLPTTDTLRRTRAEVPEEVDVAIVGAGLGGLTAAAYLARQGHTVAVFDSHYVAGGCATGFARGTAASRYVFDVGVHYVGDAGPGGAFEQLLAPLDAHVEFAPLDPDGFDTLVFPDFRFRIPVGRDLFRDRLVELFPEERRGIDRYVGYLAQLEGFVDALDAQDGAMSPRVGLHLMRRAPAVAASMALRWNMSSLLDRCTRDPRLRAVLLGQSGDYGLPPSEVSPLLHCALANHYFRGAWYPKGGGQVIADRIADSAEQAGASVHLQTLVDRIVVEDGRATGVQITPRGQEPRTVRARAVISNADAKRTMLELVGPEHLPKRWIRRATDWTVADGIFMTCLGVKGDLALDGMGRTNYWIFDHYDTERLYTSVRSDPDAMPQGAYITSASMKDPGGHNAPEGVSTVEVMTVLPGDLAHWGLTQGAFDDGSYRGQAVYQDRKQRLEDQMVGRLETMFPGTAERIVFQESATPISHMRYTRASSGSGYGLAATPSQFALGRPRARLGPQGLYIAGASARSGHGILSAIRSGRTTALELAKDLA